MANCLLALGANVGDARESVEQAIQAIDAIPGLAIIRQSSISPTTPIGGQPGQQEFANGAAIAETDLSPYQLLAAMQHLEQKFGRQRSKRWAPRTLDIDLLLFEEQTIETAELVVPHPRMSFRPFVLDSATEIASDWLHPVLNTKLGELHRRLHEGDDSLLIYGGTAADRRWHAERLAKEFTNLVICNDLNNSDQASNDLLLAIASAAEYSTELPKLAIQIRSENEAPRPGIPTLAIPAGSREEVVFDTRAAVECVWADLCRESDDG